MTNEQGWKETLEDLDLRRHRSRSMGGAERLAKHHDKGKLDARARLEHLLDKGSFREFGTLVGGDVAADGIVAGSGLINGSSVMVGPKTSRPWRAASGRAETPNATGWPNLLCATRTRS